MPAVPLPRNQFSQRPALHRELPDAGRARSGRAVLRTARQAAARPADLVGESLNAGLPRPEPGLPRRSSATARRWRPTAPETPATRRLFSRAARSIAGVLARPGRYLDAIMDVSQPTLLIFGEHDKLVPVAAGRALAKTPPGLDLRREPRPRPRAADRRSGLDRRPDPRLGAGRLAQRAPPPCVASGLGDGARLCDACQVRPTLYEFAGGSRLSWRSPRPTTPGASPIPS